MKLRSIALAAAFPVALLAAAPITASAATDVPTDTTLEAYPPPSGQWPAHWSTLLDDTAALTIAVPSWWSEIDTEPAVNEDGSPRAWISATTDERRFFPPDGEPDTFDVPGVIYIAAPYEADTARLLEASEYHAVCVAAPLQVFDNATFAGHVRSFTACGGTGTTIVQVAAHPADRSFTALVLVQLTGEPDDAVTLDGVLSSIGRYVLPAG